MIPREKWWESISRFSTPPQRENYGNLLSLYFGLKFVKPTYLLKKIINSWFDEFFFRWEYINFWFFHNVHTTLWKLQKFTATVFSQIFRQITVLLKNFTVNGFDEKYFAWQWISAISTVCTLHFTVNFLWLRFYVKSSLALWITSK